MSYYVITSNEDGIKVRKVGDIRKWIRDEMNDTKPEYQPTFLKEIPEIDRGYFMAEGRSVLIIKGEIVVPKPVEIVTEYEVE